MDLQCRETQDSLLVTLDGQLDETAASSLPGRLSLMCDGTSQQKIILDLGNCKVEGCLGYGALVAFRLSPSILKRHVTIQNAMPTVATGMKALRFEKLFTIA
ncbi:MAG: STAS domain-containing protein [Silvanigrellaceae bacterium]